MWQNRPELIVPPAPARVDCQVRERSEPDPFFGASLGRVDFHFNFALDLDLSLCLKFGDRCA